VEHGHDWEVNRSPLRSSVSIRVVFLQWLWPFPFWYVCGGWCTTWEGSSFVVEKEGRQKEGRLKYIQKTTAL
jgi:hypothetical protein